MTDKPTEPQQLKTETLVPPHPVVPQSAEHQEPRGKPEVPLGAEEELKPRTEEKEVDLSAWQLRKFDSDDIVKLRAADVIITRGYESVSVDTGMLQKKTIVLGVRSGPAFKDIIDEQKGVTPEIYARRMNEEFRRVDPSVLTRLFRDIQLLNKADLDPAALKKA